MNSEFTPQYKTKIVDEHIPSEAWFLSYSHLTTEGNVHSVQKHCRRQPSRTLLSSTMSDLGCLTQFPTKCSSRAVARCGSLE